MTIRTILTEPNSILRQVSKPVEEVGNVERELMKDMLETMYAANGIGLAAIQIGVPKRVIVLDISKKENEKNPMYFVNPVIKNQNSNLSTYEEGCLSVPNIFVEVDRPSACEVEYLDYHGEKQILKVEGLLATCVQHECDHLDGKLMLDYLSKLKKTMILKKLSKQKVKSARIIV